MVAEHPTKSGWEKGTGFWKLSSESLPTVCCLSDFLCSSFHLQTLHHHPCMHAFCPFICSQPIVPPLASHSFLGDHLKYSLIGHLESFTVLPAFMRGQKAALNAETALSPSFHHKMSVPTPVRAVLQSSYWLAASASFWSGRCVFHTSPSLLQPSQLSWQLALTSVSWKVCNSFVLYGKLPLSLINMFKSLPL